MRLQLTLSKENIYKQFTIGADDLNAKIRIKNNILVVSKELVAEWKKYIDSKGCIKYFDDWFYGVAIPQGIVKKVKIVEDAELQTENEILIKTCELSEDKILVAESNIVPNDKKDIIKFISSKIFNNEKLQQIEIKDIEDVELRKVYTNIFSIYETPIVLKVSKNLDSSILAEYLSNFYKGTSKLIISDNFLDNEENLRNFRTYILPYINKENCEIITKFFWDNGERKKELERKFNNIDGYKCSVKKLPDKSQAHKFYIESDKYTLYWGYRLKIFGGRDNGCTEEDNVTIIRK